MVAIQVIGDVSAACLGSIDRMPTERELSGAIVSQGLTSMVGGLLGGLPTSALGQNVGIICSNKVVNKWVFVIIAAVFAIAGLFPQLSAVLSAIPQPVIGGATVGVFGTITMNGVRMFTREGLTQRTTTIVGTSVVFGLGIWMASGCLAGEGMPAWVSTVIGSNAVTPTAIMAIVLNLILPQTPVVAQHIDAAKTLPWIWSCPRARSNQFGAIRRGRIASSADAMRRQAALQRVCPFGEALTGEGPFPV